MTRRERRTEAAKKRRWQANRRSIDMLSLLLFFQAKAGKLSRKEARRRLDAESVRRFGRHRAALLASRLPRAS